MLAQLTQQGKEQLRSSYESTRAVWRPYGVILCQTPGGIDYNQFHQCSSQLVVYRVLVGKPEGETAGETQAQMGG